MPSAKGGRLVSSKAGMKHESMLMVGFQHSRATSEKLTPSMTGFEGAEHKAFGAR